MIFRKKESTSRSSVIIGFVVSYVVFTVILFLVLSFMEKIPRSWSVFSLAPYTLSLVIAGLLLRGYLK